MKFNRAYLLGAALMRVQAATLSQPSPRLPGDPEASRQKTKRKQTRYANRHLRRKYSPGVSSTLRKTQNLFREVGAYKPTKKEVARYAGS